MSSPVRAKKIAHRIKTIVAQFFADEFEDSRAGFASVVDVQVSPSLTLARVYYTGPVLIAESAAAEELDEYWPVPSAAEEVRTRLDQFIHEELALKYSPKVQFIHLAAEDAASWHEFELSVEARPEFIRDLDWQLAQAARRDAQIKATANGKTPAGPEHPYRKNPL